MSSPAQAQSTITLECEPPRDIQQQLSRQLDQWPLLPDLAVQALEMTKSPNTPISDFIQVVERDALLAAEILQIANSAFFPPVNPITSLHQAVVRVGLRQSRDLILSASLKGMMRQMPPETEQMRDWFWRHSYLTGLIGLHLYRETGFGFQGEAFTAGLIHDLGRMLLAMLIPASFASISPMDQGENCLEQEQATLGTNHCVVGAWYASMSGLPTSLVDVIRYHHYPEQAPENVVLVTMVHVADLLADVMHRQGTEAEMDLSQLNVLPQLDALGARPPGGNLETAVRSVLQNVSAEAAELTGLPN